jgi:hypothetical protein
MKDGLIAPRLREMDSPAAAAEAQPLPARPASRAAPDATR